MQFSDTFNIVPIYSYSPIVSILSYYILPHDKDLTHSSICHLLLCSSPCTQSRDEIHNNYTQTFNNSFSFSGSYLPSMLSIKTELLSKHSNECHHPFTTMRPLSSPLASNTVLSVSLPASS